MNLEDCGLSTRAINVLREKYYSLNQIRGKLNIESFVVDLLKQRNCGRKTLAEILKVIGRSPTRKSYKCPICEQTHWCYAKLDKNGR